MYNSILQIYNLIGHRIFIFIFGVKMKNSVPHNEASAATTRTVLPLYSKRGAFSTTAASAAPRSTLRQS